MGVPILSEGVSGMEATYASRPEPLLPSLPRLFYDS